MTSDPRVGLPHVTDVVAARHGPARLKALELKNVCTLKGDVSFVRMYDKLKTGQVICLAVLRLR